MGNPAHPALRLCKTLVSRPGRAASTGARVTRAGAALYAVSGSAPARPALGSTPGTPDSGTACGTFPEPRGGRAGWVGEGPANRRGGCQAPRLRAGRPAIQLSRPSPISRALSSPGASGPMGNEQGGATGSGRANERGASSEGAGLGSRGPLGPSRRRGWAWARWRGPRRRAGGQEGLRGRGSGSGERGVAGGAKVSRAGRTRGGRDGPDGCHGHRGVGRVAHARGVLRGAAGTEGSGVRRSQVGYFPFHHT